MARAPARCAPSTKARLRSLGNESLNAKSLSMADAFHHPENYQSRNREAITLVWMMARMLPVMLN
jgi:hypothetical protein